MIDPVWIPFLEKLLAAVVICFCAFMLLRDPK